MAGQLRDDRQRADSVRPGQLLGRPRVRFGDAAAVSGAAAADLRRLSERVAAGAGFIERQPLYQLYYLLNRSNLFGGQHLVAAQRAVEALLQPEAS